MYFPAGDTLQKGAPTLPQILKDNGYYTIHAGKYHLSEYVTKYPIPQEIGFDVNIGGDQRGQPGSFYGKDNYARGGSTDNRGSFQVPGLEKYHGTNTYLTEAAYQ